MATGICASALADVGQRGAGLALLVLAGACLAALIVLLVCRLGTRPRHVLADLADPTRAFGYFAVVAAANVVAAGLAGYGRRDLAVPLAALAAAIWLILTYTIPVRLILGSRDVPVLAAVDGTWFLWVVGTQSVAVAVAVLASGRAMSSMALLAVSMWSVGVVLYLVIATLVVARLLSSPVRPADLTAPYWIAMGATAITVLAAAQILAMPERPAVVAARPVLAGLATLLWAFGTWLIPLLVIFGLRRYRTRRAISRYRTAWWSAVFPLGMYAVASNRFGTVAHLPLVSRIGVVWTPVAESVWLVVFVLMVIDAGRAVRAPAGASGGVRTGRTAAGETKGGDRVDSSEPPSRVGVGEGEPDDVIAQLCRWQDSGAVWRVVRRSPDHVIIALLTCSAGEEVGRISCGDPQVIAFVDEYESSQP
jgi:tellurite resistance protein TehA-like permease